MEETMSTRRRQFKADARQLLDRNFRFYLLLFLPIFIIMIVTAVPQWMNGAGADNPGYNLLSLLSIISGLLTVGVSFVLIDLQRGVAELTEPVSKSFTIFNRGAYLWGAFALQIITSVFTILWSVLLLVPGIIKGLAYSQAIYIYRDYLDQGHKIGFLEAITLSRKMMDGHKWEYFVMQLSFIGWGIACVLIIPIIWVVPYMNQTMANFYVNLAAEEDESDEEPTVVSPVDDADQSTTESKPETPADGDEKPADNDDKTE